MEAELIAWGAFGALVLVLLALDLGIFHRRERVDSIAESLAWTGFWIALALGFNLFVYFLYEAHWLGFGTGYRHDLTGAQAALQFFTGFLLEKSLSIDNIFVIAMVFAYFRIPLAYQHRVLYWGIVGAIVLRGVMIAAGGWLIARFDWITYLFGAFLLVSAVKLLVVRHDNLRPEDNVLVRWLRSLVPTTEGFRGQAFFVREGGRLAATPLFVALLVVETSDVVFAVDSIPAVFAITRDPFLVFTSNVFAVLGLRSLYFALAGLVEHLRYLKTSLVFVLAYVGVKMLLVHHHPIPIVVSLAIISGLLGVGASASIVALDRDTARLASPLGEELERLMAVGRRQVRRVFILVGGSTVLLIGIAMIVLPGPALVVIPAGLGILALEFMWARRWLVRMRRTLRRFGRAAADFKQRRRQPPP